MKHEGWEVGQGGAAVDAKWKATNDVIACPDRLEWHLKI